MPGTAEKSFASEEVARHCLAHHPDITASPGVEGIPYLAGTNITVTEVLARLYVHGSFKAIEDSYGDITEQQMKEAVSYALIYMELNGKTNVRYEAPEQAGERT